MGILVVYWLMSWDWERPCKRKCTMLLLDRFQGRCAYIDNRITFLHTLYVLAQAKDPHAILPKHLRTGKIQTLILCPPTLINNWLEEFHKWLGNEASIHIMGGKPRFFDPNLTREARLRIVEEWHKTGGILLLGYDMFRNLVSDPEKLPDGTEKPNKMLQPEPFRSRFQKALLDDTSLVIADEAHMMRRIDSHLSQAAARFNTPSRIALTGSPMANSLGEYYAMIEWVDPGYLGAVKEFNRRFAIPIRDGLYKDCERAVHRKALRQLRILSKEIQPKVNRASITVLKGSLKPKMEFVLTIKLTETQKKLYSAIIRTALATSNEMNDMSNAGLWKWLGLLLLVCNHPHALQTKIRDIENQETMATQTTKQPKSAVKKAKKSTKSGEKNHEDSDPSEEDEAVTGKGAVTIPSSLLRELQQVLTNLKQPLSADLSVKSQILWNVISHARSAGDRVLVFSHSIPTLSYMSEFLRKQDVKHLRLDGATPISSRQDIVKEFNKGGYDVCLISTRAGGTGLNFIGANRVVLMDYSYNPFHEEQAVGRAYRIGQEKAVFVYRFVMGGTYEKPLYNQCLLKLQMAHRAVDKRNSARQAMQPKQYLFMPTDDTEVQNLAEHREKDPLVLDKFLGHRGITSIDTTEVLQVDAEDEQLTAEEEKEVDAEYRLLRLQKENPAAYMKEMAAKQLMNEAPRVPNSSYVPFNGVIGVSNPIPAAFHPPHSLFNASQGSKSRPLEHSRPSFLSSPKKPVEPVTVPDGDPTLTSNATPTQVISDEIKAREGMQPIPAPANMPAGVPQTLVDQPKKRSEPSGAPGLVVSNGTSGPSQSALGTPKETTSPRIALDGADDAPDTAPQSKRPNHVRDDRMRKPTLSPSKRKRTEPPLSQYSEKGFTQEDSIVLSDSSESPSIKPAKKKKKKQKASAARMDGSFDLPPKSSSAYTQPSRKNTSRRSPLVQRGTTHSPQSSPDKDLPPVRPHRGFIMPNRLPDDVLKNYGTQGKDD